MTQFTKRAEKIEAIQWTGDNTAEVVEWLARYTDVDEASVRQVWSYSALRDTHPVYTSEPQLIVPVFDAPEIAYKNHWLVLTDGKLTVVGNERFIADYEPTA